MNTLLCFISCYSSKLLSSFSEIMDTGAENSEGETVSKLAGRAGQQKQKRSETVPGSHCLHYIYIFSLVWFQGMSTS